MNKTEAEPRRDALLLKLLQTPPKPRAERKRQHAKPDEQASRIPASESSGEKRIPSA